PLPTLSLPDALPICSPSGLPVTLARVALPTGAPRCAAARLRTTRSVSRTPTAWRRVSMRNSTHSREACAPCVVVLLEHREGYRSTTTTRRGMCEVCYADHATLFSVTLVTSSPSSEGASST